MLDIFAIYDEVADELGPLMLYHTTEQAQRAFPTAFENSKVNIKDFKLLHLGHIVTNLKGMFLDDEPAIVGEIPLDVTPYIASTEVK